MVRKRTVFLVFTVADGIYSVLRVPEIVISTPKMLSVTATYQRLSITVGMLAGIPSQVHAAPKFASQDIPGPAGALAVQRHRGPVGLA